MALIGLLNCVKLSHTQVFSMSKILIVPDWKPHAKIGNYGWAATHRGWSMGLENSTTWSNVYRSQRRMVSSLLTVITFFFARWKSMQIIESVWDLSKVWYLWFDLFKTPRLPLRVPQATRRPSAEISTEHTVPSCFASIRNSLKSRAQILKYWSSEPVTQKA